MRLVKLALISLIILFLLVTAMSLLIPSHIRISKAINTGAPKDSIFALIKNEGRWQQWHPAFMHGDSAGNVPPIHITPKVENDSMLVFQVQAGNQRPVLNGWQIYHHASTDSLTLQWYMDFHLQWYPWQKFGSLFYENTYGVMMEQGLNNIKKLATR